MRVFCDRSSIALNESVWGAVETALRGSAIFILLASTSSAQSPWVQRELLTWQAQVPRRPLLIVVTDGDIVWNQHNGDFDWQQTTALPDCLRGGSPTSHCRSTCGPSSRVGGPTRPQTQSSWTPSRRLLLRSRTAPRTNSSETTSASSAVPDGSAACRGAAATRRPQRPPRARRLYRSGRLRGPGQPSMYGRGWQRACPKKPGGSSHQATPNVTHGRLAVVTRRTILPRPAAERPPWSPTAPGGGRRSRLRNLGHQASRSRLPFTAQDGPT